MLGCVRRQIGHNAIQRLFKKVDKQIGRCGRHSVTVQGDRRVKTPNLRVTQHRIITELNMCCTRDTGIKHSVMSAEIGV